MSSQETDKDEKMAPSTQALVQNLAQQASTRPAQCAPIPALMPSITANRVSAKSASEKIEPKE